MMQAYKPDTRIRMNLTAPKHIAILLAAVLLVVVLVTTRGGETPTTTIPEESPTATTTLGTPDITIIPTTPAPLAGNKGSEQIEQVTLGKTISWNYQGLITDEEGKARTRAAIEQLSAQMKEPGADIYDLDLSIAQQYDRIGDGERAYRYLTYATVVNPAKALAFVNMGNLFAKLDSIEPAETALLIAVEKEPQFPYTHLALTSFYVLHMPSATGKIEQAFTYALERTGRNETVLKEYASWLEGQGKVRESITVWKEVLAQNPTNATAVTAKISKLEATLNGTSN